MLHRVNWDVNKYLGQTVRLRVVDQKQRSWAHVAFDDFSVQGKLVDAAAQD